MKIKSTAMLKRIYIKYTGHRHEESKNMHGVRYRNKRVIKTGYNNNNIKI